MKVLHVLNSTRFSGAENVVCQIIHMFQNDDYEMAYTSPNGQISDALKERGVDFYPLESLKVSELKKVIKQFQPDVIHAHDMKASFVVSRCNGKIPFVSHIHNNAFDSRKISLKSIAYLFAALRSKHIFWVSNSSFNGYCFHGILDNKSSILYNVIDIDALKEKMLLDNNSYKYDVCYLGRLTYQKNPQRCVKVIYELKKINPNIKAVFIGTGELETEVKELCNKLNLCDSIDFLGFQSNPLKILHDSKVMLMTSRWEGTPMCALEAMALGVPIVCTPTDGLKDLITNDEPGYISDDDLVISKKISELISDQELHKRLSDNCIRHAEDINNIDKYKYQISKCYNDIIK
jgi:glycosyltransferase involved in cell wall biosynthesis